MHATCMNSTVCVLEPCDVYACVVWRVVFDESVNVFIFNLLFIVSYFTHMAGLCIMIYVYATLHIFLPA